jgi:hypothetical protein
MDRRTRLILLAVGLLLAVVALVPRVAAARLPGNHRGYAPVQPIAYSHRLHAGELEIPCLYCHFAAERGRHAGIPPAQVCMNCHKTVTAPFAAVREEEKRATEEGRKPEKIVSPELKKLLDAVESGTPIEWVQVHRLPDFAYLDHRVHVAAGVTCQRCHGPIETMERVRQENDLSMGWCLDCHRHTNLTGPDGRPLEASQDCAGCHY